jgi:predicted nucleic acid-binding protein
MWVAACCSRQRLPLVTLDRKDFVDFRQATQTSSKPPG